MLLHIQCRINKPEIVNFTEIGYRIINHVTELIPENKPSVIFFDNVGSLFQRYAAVSEVSEFDKPSFVQIKGIFVNPFNG